MSQEWDHLLPLVAALVAGGNAALHGGFIPTQSGYECPMREPLDFDLLRRLVPADDKNVHLALNDDLLWCSHCWAAVYGSAHQPNDPPGLRE